MLETLKNAWKLPDLRRKIMYTLMILVIFRLGSAIPVPYLNAAAIGASGIFGDGNLMGYYNMLTGGALEQASMFALSISPYITASIVIQLLTVAIPYLENLAKEGEEGRKRINKITRYTGVALAVLQSFAYYSMLRRGGAVVYTEGWESVFACTVIVACFSAGAMFVMWLSERIDAKGIGNGISMILFAGIVAGGKDLIQALFIGRYADGGYAKGYIPAAIDAIKTEGFKWGGDAWFAVSVPVVAIIFLFVITFIVVMYNAERRIPVQYAKRVVGRKMYGGQSTHIPIKVNMSGVLPVIFSSSLLAIPGTLAAFFPAEEGTFWHGFVSLFNYDSWLYAVLYFLLIIAFNYFYVAIQYNPIEMANNLRKNNGAIPGIRPGKPTSDFIGKIISKITIVGAFFLAFVAIMPIAIGAVSGLNISLGGTTIIIIVGVSLDTVRQLESQMMMRHYKGFLE
ncbi:MAG: preprotein translocase subunit SecY [Oscillospiraceae bacterium]|nr:preprotein translocase subunit SecY [Oscillospiraceae bacterium]